MDTINSPFSQLIDDAMSLLDHVYLELDKRLMTDEEILQYNRICDQMEDVLKKYNTPKFRNLPDYQKVIRLQYILSVFPEKQAAYKKKHSLKAKRVKKAHAAEKEIDQGIYLIDPEMTSGMWYENTSILLKVECEDELNSYIEAYGTRVKYGKSGKPLIVKKEKDEIWGYIIMSEKQLPFVVIYRGEEQDHFKYHFYTFECTHDEFDFESAIEERISLLMKHKKY